MCMIIKSYLIGCVLEKDSKAQQKELECTTWKLACALRGSKLGALPGNGLLCKRLCTLGHIKSFDTWVHKKCTSLYALSVTYQRMCTYCALKCSRTWSVQVVHILRTKVHFQVVHKACYLWVHKQVSKLCTPALVAVKAMLKHQWVQKRGPISIRYGVSTSGVRPRFAVGYSDLINERVLRNNRG